MNSFSRFGRFFVPVATSTGAGLTAVLAGATMTSTNNPPTREYETFADTGHPHATTQKKFIKDRMHSTNVKVEEKPFEWPRLSNNFYTDSTQTISAQEATVLQRHMAENGFIPQKQKHQQHTEQPKQREQEQQTQTQTETSHTTHTTHTAHTTDTADTTDTTQTMETMETMATLETRTEPTERVENVLDSSNVVEMREETEEEAESLMLLSEYIDHTALKAFTSKEDIKNLCNEAMKYNFKSVCVNPVFVQYCSDLLKDSNVKVCTVIGFPLGANHMKIKVLEALQAVQDGATEIDMVISIAHIKSNEWDEVETEVRSVVEAVESSSEKIVVKVILETAMLTHCEIIKACQVCVSAGADYVKTSTGFGGGGATLENVKLMKETVENELKKLNRNENECQVKASGGVKTFEMAKEMVRAGASRIGTSSGVAIVADDTHGQTTTTSMY